MFEVSVAGTFSATHAVSLPDGALEPLHGHDWRVRVSYAGDKLNEQGVLEDFVAVRARLDEVLAALDGRELNALAWFSRRPASAENVAVYIAEQMVAETTLRAVPQYVEIEEAPGCVARYWPARRTR
jgi:6-pyruvoyltetrahydropterin/6-carboxytetrahydropterin synthase